ncbi:retrotransposon protein, putative, ty1-copia subclass, partial [Tanacetum coccineum]
MVAWFLGLEDVLSWLLVEGKHDAIIVEINAIALFRQAIGSSPGRNDRTTSPESNWGNAACVFETFKVFKNEVDNQLEKTIKALQSDRGGEYISQEFKDYLKAYGILQQLTPQYTPQHKGMSERRNHTLLDMVRSMMNLTTLPLSFWDYALESATRIVNIVPTKK